MFAQVIENMKKFDLSQVNGYVDSGLDAAEKYTKQGLEYVKSSAVRENLETAYASSFAFTREMISAGHKLGTMFAENTKANLKNFDESFKKFSAK